MPRTPRAEAPQRETGRLPKPTKRALRLNALLLEAQHLEAQRNRNPSAQPPSQARHIDPASPEGRVIAQRFSPTNSRSNR